MLEYMKLFRVKHWIKNIIIFFPVFFSGDILSQLFSGKFMLGVLIFCLSTSCVYIINDISDVELDRKHETKKNRPIASGKISVKNAYIALGILATIIVISLIILDNRSATLILVTYLVSNIFYSKKLKNYPIVDVSLVALGFYLRALYGAVLGNVEISFWFYLTLICFAYYFAFGKRRNEYKKSKDKARKVMSKYTYEYLDKFYYMFLTLGIGFYSLWCVEKSEIYTNIIYTIPALLILVMKYSLDLEMEDSYGDPVDVILSDKILMCIGVVYGILMVVSIYS